MKNIRPLTPEGKRIKKALIDLGMTQTEFCREYNINRQRLTDIMHTEYKTFPALAVRLRVFTILRELGVLSSECILNERCQYNGKRAEHIPYAGNMFREVNDA